MLAATYIVLRYKSTVLTPEAEMTRPQSEKLTAEDCEALDSLRYALRRFMIFSSYEARKLWTRPSTRRLETKGPLKPQWMLVERSSKPLLAPRAATGFDSSRRTDRPKDKRLSQVVGGKLTF